MTGSAEEAASTDAAKQGHHSSLVGEVLSDVREAVSDEISAAFTGESAIDLRGGRFVGQVDGLDVWTFEADQAIPVPPETRARVKAHGHVPVEAQILAVNDLDVVIGTAYGLADAEDSVNARLSVDPLFIYERLNARLSDFDADPRSEHVLESLLDINDAADHDDRTTAAPELPGLSAEQRNAVGRSSRDGVQFVWGPPGTGKTGTLAAMVNHLVDEGQRVLVLAHANAAVDVALKRVADRMDAHVMLAAGRVLRVGPPAASPEQRDLRITPDEILRRTQPALVEARDSLSEQRSSLARQLRAPDADKDMLTAQLEATRAELSQIETKLTEARNELVLEAVVVGATLARFVVNDLIWTWPADVIIIDEVSMASVPFVLAAGTKRPRTLALFGDFRQLPPISQASTAGAERWLTRDIFEVAGVVDRIELGRPDGRLSILQTQFRMGADIGAVVSKFAYFNMLRTHIGADERAAEISRVGPASGSQLVIVDTSEWQTACLTDVRPDSFTRFNLTSCMLAVTVAHRLRQSGLSGVGVIAAYRGQARLAAELLRSHTGISAATTHRFQGSEDDAIVLDLVDAVPQSGPSMLTGSDPDLATRLLNVAASRSRGKLIMLVDLGFLEFNHPPASPARQLIDRMRERDAAIVAASDVIDIGSTPWSPTWVEGLTQLTCLFNADCRVDVSVPNESFTAGLAALVTLAADHNMDARLRVPVAVASELEDSDIDIRLKTLGASPIALVNDAGTGQSAMLVGNRTPSAPAAVLRSPGAIRTAWKLLTGEIVE
jgi:hypothetical protein